MFQARTNNTSDASNESDIFRLIERITLIINCLHFPEEYRDESTITIFEKNDIDEIQKLVHKPTSGFHELFVKCKIYLYLFEKMDSKQFLKLQISEQVLIETLFNPTFEDEIRQQYGYENLRKLIEDYAELADEINLDENLNISGYLVGQSKKSITKYLDKTTRSLKDYINWYLANKNTVYQANDSVIRSSYDATVKTYIKDLMKNDDNTVEMNQSGLFKANKSRYIGTSELRPCIAIISVMQNTNNKNTTVNLFHCPGNYSGSVESIYKESKQEFTNISIYLIGGHPIQIGEYLPILTNGTYPIKDVRLCTPDLQFVDCVVYSENNQIQIGYSGVLDHNEQLKLSDQFSLFTNNRGQKRKRNNSLSKEELQKPENKKPRLTSESNGGVQNTNEGEVQKNAESFSP